MRTIDATLKTALESESYDPFFKLLFKSDFGGSTEYTATNITKYKLDPTGRLEITAVFNSQTEDFGDGHYCVLRRGVIVSGVEYYLDTSHLSVETITVDGSYIKVIANLTGKQKVTLAGDDTYWNVIQAFGAEVGLSVSRKEPLETFWNNTFLPTGKQIALNNANSFRNILKQKFFMNFTDAGNDTILFWSAKNFEDPTEYTITTERVIENTYNKFVNGIIAFLWRNDAGTIFNADPITWEGVPTYNLGFIKDGDTLPRNGSYTTTSDDIYFIKSRSALPSPIQLPINLEYLTGDYVTIHSTENNLSTIGYILVTEYFDPKQSPAWGIKIEFWDFIANTEGGSLPSTIERVAAYTPLVSSGFDGNLTPSVNNLQALAEAVDDLSIAAGPATTAVNDFQVGDGLGAWVKKTLAQTITILRTSLDSVYAALLATTAANDFQVGNGSGAWVKKTLAETITILRTSLDSVYAAVTHSHAASDVTSGTMATARLGSGTANSSSYLRGDQTWATISASGLPEGHFHGFTLSNDPTDPTNDIGIAAGSIRDDTNTVDIILASALIKRLDASWAVGTNQGFLDTGSIANTTYHVWAIKRSDTGVVDVLASTSASSPTMPANYDYKAYLGAIVRLSGAIKLFKQLKDTFLWDTPTVDVNVTNPGTSAVTRTLTLPTGKQVIAIVNLLGYGTSAAANTQGILLSDLSMADIAPYAGVFSVSAYSDVAGITQNGAVCMVRTDTSAQIRSRVQVSAAGTGIVIGTQGWIDPRGRT